MGATAECNLCLALLIIVLFVFLVATAFATSQQRSSFSTGAVQFGTESATESAERGPIPYTGTEPINNLGSGAVPWRESAYEPAAPPRERPPREDRLAYAYAKAYPPQPYISDGTVAPIPPGEIPEMVRKGLNAGSAGIAAYMEVGTSEPEIGLARFEWFRAMRDKQTGAAARARRPDPRFELAQGEPGTLIPESKRGDRPLGMPPGHMRAGFADGGDSTIGYNARFIPDGPPIM